MSKKLLITFGCSWTAGIGSGYQKGMTEQQYKDIAWDNNINDQQSFRGIICRELDYHSLNFSRGGASNQEQLRLARNYFASELYDNHRQQYNEILVLWGITSTARIEIFSVQHQSRRSVLLSENLPLCKAIVADHYDHHHEISQLADEIRFWDQFFSKEKIRIGWFDSFNHHEYDRANGLYLSYQENRGSDWPSWQDYLLGRCDNPCILEEINDTSRWPFSSYRPATKNFLFKESPTRDLAHQLAILHGYTGQDLTYHYSDWNNDCDRIDFLESRGLVNPYTRHLTADAHQALANMFIDVIAAGSS